MTYLVILLRYCSYKPWKINKITDVQKYPLVVWLFEFIFSTRSFLNFFQITSIIYCTNVRDVCPRTEEESTTDANCYLINYFLKPV